MLAYFHYATHVEDLKEAKQFYTKLLGCTVGRESDRWVDLNFYGHQLSLHLGSGQKDAPAGTDGERDVPMPHFGVILDLEEWQIVCDRLVTSGIEFIVPPTTRFKGKAGEQRTMFFRDPAGNAIEIKGFAKTEDIFIA